MAAVVSHDGATDGTLARKASGLLVPDRCCGDHFSHVYAPTRGGELCPGPWLVQQNWTFSGDPELLATKGDPDSCRPRRLPRGILAGAGDEGREEGAAADPKWLMQEGGSEPDGDPGAAHLG